MVDRTTKVVAFPDQEEDARAVHQPLAVMEDTTQMVDGMLDPEDVQAVHQPLAVIEDSTTVDGTLDPEGVHAVHQQPLSSVVVGGATMVQVATKVGTSTMVPGGWVDGRMVFDMMGVPGDALLNPNPQKMI